MDQQGDTGHQRLVRGVNWVPDSEDEADDSSVSRCVLLWILWPVTLKSLTPKRFQFWLPTNSESDDVRGHD